MPLDRKNDDDAVGLEDGLGEELSHEQSLQPDTSENILRSVDKVFSFFFKNPLICVDLNVWNLFSFEKLSVQFGQAPNASRPGQNSRPVRYKLTTALNQVASVHLCLSLMSEHVGHPHIRCFVCSQYFHIEVVNLFFIMIGRALDFSKEIDAFTGSNRDLRGLELDPAEWEAITLVSNWLKAFRSATTEMSTTKKPMLSTVHAIFRGLQDHIKTILETLPDTTHPRLRDGLVAAHQKLSEYYYRSDASPYYTWAASEFQCFYINFKN